MSYHDLLGWSQLIAMVIFGAVMVGVLIYALRPGNKAKFDAAARLPLERDDDDKEGGDNGRT
jgi:cytochrome c oxidase cbb3-type subunit 4